MSINPPIRKQTFEPVDMGCVYICNIENREFRYMDNSRIAWTEDYEKRTGRHWRDRGRTEYILPAAPSATTWSVIKIYPAIQVVADPRRSPSGHDNDHEQDRREVGISAMEIAQNLLRIWTDALSGVPGGRGVAIIADDQPTAAELAGMKTNLKLYCERKVAQAQDFYTSGRAEFIGPVHQECARIIGGVFDWVTSVETNKLCPKCGGINPKSAMGCKHCGVDFEEYYRDVECYTISELKEVDPAVYERVISREKRRNAAKSSPKEPAATKA